MRYQHFLLIDDDAEDQEIFITALQYVAGNAECTAISNAKEALYRLTGGELVPDIIFLDLNMPIMTGQQFLVEIKKINRLADIPVIVISTSSHPSTIADAKKLGAEHFITKPNRFDDLVAVLQPLIH